MELEVIVHELNMWRHYLLGIRFVLMKYHYGLKHVFDQPRLNAIKERLMALISEFDFEIKHIKGKENKLAYTLSRSVYAIHLEI
jgi:hypothetical protein